MKKLMYKMFIVLIMSSCSTMIESDIYYEDYVDDFNKEAIYILENSESYKHISILFPPIYTVDRDVEFPHSYQLVDKMDNIDQKIAYELTKYGYTAKIIKDISEIEEERAVVISAVDIWQWDFKYYMHILKVYVYKQVGQKNILNAVIGSRANNSGLHDFPMPDSQIPRIINRMLNGQ